MENFTDVINAMLLLCFQGTGVYVARVGRQTKTREYKDLEAHFTANLGYSHHQKAVILDAPNNGDRGAHQTQNHQASFVTWKIRKNSGKPTISEIF